MLLALVVTFANRIGDVAVATGADAYVVERALRRDERFGRKLPLLPGPQVSGGTLMRDVHSLLGVCRTHGLDTQWLTEMIDVNAARTDALVSKLGAVGPLDGAEALLLGYVYKPRTNSVRDAPGAAWGESLVGAGARVRVYEPAVESPQLGLFRNHSTFEEAIEGIDVIVTVRRGVVEGERFREAVSKGTASTVFDVWNEFDLQDSGVRVLTPGRSPQ